MNRRTFLKATAISLLPPTLLLKGEEPLKPLQWTSFSSKFPKNKEFFIMMSNTQKLFVMMNNAQNENCYIRDYFLYYSIGMMQGKNMVSTAPNKLFLINRDQTQKTLFPPNLKQKDKNAYAPINFYMNTLLKNESAADAWQWISINDILKYIKKHLLIN